MVSSTVVMAIVAAAAVAVTTAQVIAAAPGNDQSPAPPAPAAEGPWPSAVSWVVLVVAPLLMLLAWRRGWHRLHRAPPREPLLPPLAAGMMCLAMFAAGSIGAGAARSIAGAAPDPGAEPAVLVRWHAIVHGGAILAQGVPIAIVGRLWFTRRRSAPPNRGAGAAALAGAGALMLVWPMTLAISILASLLAAVATGEPPAPIAHETLRFIAAGEGGPWLILLLAVVTLGAAITEEVMYRGLLQDALVQMQVGRWPAIALASGFFAFMHVGAEAGGRTQALLVMLPALFILSLGFGWIFERTGRLVAPITMHVLFNAANVALAVATT
jgi:membrane protease YdiL (CAAX protease family)